MAVGRDRDQRRCQLLSRQPIPPWLLFPLSQEPNTERGHQDRAGECEEFSQHICSLLCTFSPLWDVKSAAGPRGCDHLAPQWGSARVGERRQWAEDQGNLADGKRRASGMADCWESESSWTELLSFVQHNKDRIIYFCHGPCWMKSKPPRSWSKVPVCPGEQLINMIVRNDPEESVAGRGLPRPDFFRVISKL